ncbi:MAG: hypothetical protein II408_02710 [Bacteroidales bacterium]|nr:hypothetical protein [Bacteroidales bacterium]
MKRIFLLLFLTAVLIPVAAPRALAQEPQEPNLDEIINGQIENLTRIFKLDEVQVFFVDSILQNNYKGLQEEVNLTRKSGASNTETYQIISDKWMNRTDEALEKIFTKEQWGHYLKPSYGKEKKKRDKRIADRGGFQPSL